MIEQIIRSLKGELSQKFTADFDLSQEQADDSISLAQKNIIETIKDEASRGNLNGLFSILQERDDTSSNPIVTHMIRKYSGDLGTKLGLDPGHASKIAGFTIPFILHKFQDMSNDKGFDLTSLMSMLNPSDGGSDSFKG